MADLQGRKVFKVFNQDFIVDERYTVTKELGQGAYGIVWYARASIPRFDVPRPRHPAWLTSSSFSQRRGQ
jgi:hypothetical protein